MLESLLQACNQIFSVLFGPDALAYWAIPLIAGGVGWTTNWLAIQLTFYPTEFIGIPPYLGWQGIIPRNVEKMANIVVDKVISKLGSLTEVFEQMEPDKIAHHIAEASISRIEEYTDEIMTDRNAILWENLPNVLKQRVYSRARKQLPVVLNNMIQDIGENIEDLIDLKHMIVTQLSSDTTLLNRVFKQVGEKEFKFVINSGLVFGVIFGVIQMIVWILYPKAWVLPAFGCFVGYATNWLALNLIFRPLNPIKISRWTLQGVFIKRQKEVAEVFCHIVTREVMTIKHLMAAMLNGPKKDRAKTLIKKHIKPVVEGGTVKFAAQLAIGPSGYVRLKKSIEEKAIEISTDQFDDPVFNEERANLVANLIQERMENLSPAEFQDLLRPAFEEDEWILIAIGALLGLLAGTIQFLYLFAGSF
ncbi:MAG: hypothetical protein KUG82_12140 [Pseudomonadales bacterium]|nr:hypothetical protein [Pseudomonadales bacterium]